MGDKKMKHPTYISETGEKLARISIKQEEHKNQKGEKYFLYHIRVLGNTEDEVIDTIESLRKKLKRLK